MPEDRKYSRVYHDAQDDPRFVAVWPSDPCLALWLRLLVLADGTWPAPAPIPRSVRKRPLAVLVDAGLVNLVSGDLFRIHGMTKERSGRSKQAAHAADVRWHSASTPVRNTDGNARSNAEAMPNRDETSKDETSIPRASATNGLARPRPSTVDRDPELRAQRDAQRARYGDGQDDPVPLKAMTAAEQERESRRIEGLALHERFKRGELTEPQYERLLTDIGKEPDDLTRLPA